MKKYELTTETKIIFGKTLYRIRALIKFGDVDVGDFGGWVESGANLSQAGNAWVYGNARVYGNAQVCGDAQVCDNARVCDDAWVCDNAQVCGNAWVYGNARVCDDAWVCDNAQVCGNARVKKSSHLLCVGAIGSRDGFTTFFRCEDKHIYVTCGCFFGRLDKFAESVNAVHGDTKHGKAYRAAIELAKIQIDDIEVNKNAAD